MMIMASKMSGKIYYLPKHDFPAPDTLIETLINSGRLKNIGLWLQRFPLWLSNDKEEEIYETNLRDQIELINKNRLAIPSKFFPMQEYRNYFDRFGAIIKSMGSQGFTINVWDGKVAWRLVIGLGSESVYETSISIHRNYSVPVIPGSAVKGVAHAYAERNKSQTKDEIFGTQEQAGKVIFFDALPIIESGKEFLVLDIMNVHYPEYYRKGETPGDWMSPNPIFFLAVEGLKYKFTVASKESLLAKEALTLLKNALKEIGIGAKTSAGYGYFE